jgi:hypothetical protein
MNGSVTVLIVIVLGVAYRYYSQQSVEESLSVATIAGDLRSLDQQAFVHARNLTIAFGYNSNLDGVANAISILGILLQSTMSGRKIVARDHARIDTEMQLAECFTHFFSLGAAGERFVERSLFDKIVALVRSDAQTVLSPGYAFEFSA